jgi:hypothetical protein
MWLLSSGPVQWTLKKCWETNFNIPSCLPTSGYYWCEKRKRYANTITTPTGTLLSIFHTRKRSSPLPKNMAESRTLQTLYVAAHISVFFNWLCEIFLSEMLRIKHYVSKDSFCVFSHMDSNKALIFSAHHCAFLSNLKTTECLRIVTPCPSFLSFQLYGRYERLYVGNV